MMILNKRFYKVRIRSDSLDNVFNRKEDIFILRFLFLMNLIGAWNTKILTREVNSGNNSARCSGAKIYFISKNS